MQAASAGSRGAHFNKDPEKIMRELIDTRGIKAIKIWPFDSAAARNRNQYVTPQDLDQALRPVKKLRDAFGSKIDIAIEFHAQWNVTSAIRIAHALESYRPMWLEDMLMPGNFAQYHEVASATSLPLIAGERMAGKLQFQQLLESLKADKPKAGDQQQGGGGQGGGGGGQGGDGRRAVLRGLGAGALDRGDPARALHRPAAVARRLPAGAELADAD